MSVRIEVNKVLTQADAVLELDAGTGITLTQTESDGRVKVTVTATGVTSAGNEIASFARSGAIVVAAGTGRFLMPGAGTVISVVAAINTAPTGAAVICDVNKNGTTIFTTQENRPSIAINGHATVGFAIPDVTAFVAGDYLTVDVDQVGSTVAGADLVVQVVYALT